ncbi:hypothetical protein MARPO_0058s0076 [Marchantia polymorpha]|uniref:Uncharacterized protein n=1 Tax=Marchantia polymorpha TaxID=3197 RepID=A0A2R6WU11_MARPO|nr:hypothetical protein MARPO_0058s0076 [Marchantia polymorpha]|eukprot:PTQ37294.1 hypothetical protein MARPO_0058s0076 [Marchantia polymorpha]
MHSSLSIEAHSNSRRQSLRSIDRSIEGPTDRPTDPASPESDRRRVFQRRRTVSCRHRAQASRIAELSSVDHAIFRPSSVGSIAVKKSTQPSGGPSLRCGVRPPNGWICEREPSNKCTPVEPPGGPNPRSPWKTTSRKTHPEEGGVRFTSSHHVSSRQKTRAHAAEEPQFETRPRPPAARKSATDNGREIEAASTSNGGRGASPRAATSSSRAGRGGEGGGATDDVGVHVESSILSRGETLRFLIGRVNRRFYRVCNVHFGRVASRKKAPADDDDQRERAGRGRGSAEGEERERGREEGERERERRAHERGRGGRSSVLSRSDSRRSVLILERSERGRQRDIERGREGGRK